MTLRLVNFVGAEMAPHLPALAQLGTVVFREPPHLYDGDGRYDEAHIAALGGSRRSLLILAFHNDTIVGASACLPLEDATPNIQSPFLRRGLPLDEYFYFSESVLLPAFRGRGIGATWFHTREQHARTVSGSSFSCFCTFRRADHRSQLRLWYRLGYAPAPDLVCSMPWQEIGQKAETDHMMQFWTKPLHLAVRPIATADGSA
jgi:GNAT superfamily N-acetyltransferase